MLYLISSIIGFFTSAVSARARLCAEAAYMRGWLRAGARGSVHKGLST